MEGTLGAAECEFFRENVREAALPGRSRFGEVCWVVLFERGRYRTAAGLHRAFRCRSAQDRDRGCPSQSGWGKSSAASGRRGGGSKGLKSQSDPWPEATRLADLARGVATCRAAVRCRNYRQGLDSSEVCSGDALL